MGELLKLNGVQEPGRGGCQVGLQRSALRRLDADDSNINSQMGELHSSW
jgi:hypothetical protein